MWRALIFLSLLHIIKCQSNYTHFNTSIVNFDELINAEGITKNEVVAYLSMIDASVKIPNIISFYDLGNFDECYRIKTDTFYGKYCLGTLPLPSPSGYNENLHRKIRAMGHPTPRASVFTMQYNFGICFPSTMSAEEIEKYTNTSVSEETCYTQAKEEKLTGGAIATICFFSVIVATAVMQTAYDVYLHYTGQKTKHELLLAFSVLTNGRKLITPSTNPDQLLCLNGIRAISMVWVVVSHVFQMGYGSPLQNMMDVQPFMDNVANMFLLGATVSVDTFFMAGGLVTVYTFLKAVDKGVKFNIVMYYIHRYLRLTPAFAAVILVYRNLVIYFDKAPLWHNIKQEIVDPCQNNWWISLLYLQNYFRDRELCVPQAWYLDVDMQLFILSPIILLSLVKWRRQTVYALYFLVVCGVIAPFTEVYVQKVGGMMSGDPDYLFNYYYQTYTRFGPYIIGMIFGVFIYELKKSKQVTPIAKSYIYFTWLVTVAVLVAGVYAGHDQMVDKTPDYLSNAFYLSLNRSGWAAAVGVVVYLCVSGRGGPIDAFLSLPIFQFITKLSYAIYLIHYELIMIRDFSQKTAVYFSTWTMFHMFWGDFMFSLILALPLSLLFESPIIILEKYIFRR